MILIFQKLSKKFMNKKNGAQKIEAPFGGWKESLSLISCVYHAINVQRFIKNISLFINNTGMACIT